MKTKFLLCALVGSFLSLVQVSAKNIFVVEGPEEVYNRIRVVNETSQTDFTCRIVKLSADESTQQVYGVFNLKGRDDEDSVTDRFPRGTKFAIQMQKDFPTEISYYIEYKDCPLFDVVIVHLTDPSTEFNED